MPIILIRSPKCSFDQIIKIINILCKDNEQLRSLANRYCIEEAVLDEKIKSDKLYISPEKSDYSVFFWNSREAIPCCNSILQQMQTISGTNNMKQFQTPQTVFGSDTCSYKIKLIKKGIVQKQRIVFLWFYPVRWKLQKPLKAKSWRGHVFNLCNQANCILLWKS